jgi:ubiquinone/menaquinone biosynthesis C-methylase UbiE
VVGIVRTVAYEYGRRNRARKAALVRQVCEGVGATSLLLVGVSSDHRQINNLTERALLDACPTVVASGLHDDDETWPDYRRADALQLPFDDGQFDVVFANAVIEHVGGEQRQRRMLAEVDRVASLGWVVTTPNRWFPVEAHRHTFLSHWRRSWAPTGGITRLLGIRELEAMLPDGRVSGLPMMSPTLAAVHQSR